MDIFGGLMYRADFLVLKLRGLARNILCDDDGSLIDDVFGDGWGQSSEDENNVLGGVAKASKGLGNSVYSLIFYLVVMGASIAILVNCLKILFGGSQGKQEGKGALVWILAAVALATCAVSIVKVVASGSQTLFK